MLGIAICCLGVLLVVYLVGGFMTNGFTDFGFWGCNDRHKFCECCGRRVTRVGSNETPESLVFGGHDVFYVCKRCGHKQCAHCFTYD